ncbi:MAG: CDP-alcohol phosphatidyltransferase family protein [Deltaproteobacteria bacterium]|nr:CDP-alcohol phosphatidyltransferase family protein [Deltaproteobacteria bacterium]
MQLFDRFPPRFLLPNAVTSTSIVLGLLSLHTAATATSAEELAQAAWMIMYTVLLDKLDGSVARAARASSEFGVQLDSFSDFLSFGVAPAFLLTRALPFFLPQLWGSGLRSVLLLAVGGLYAVCTALRLAKFNITTAHNHPRFFRGLPSTSSGGILASAFLTHLQFGLPSQWLSAAVGWMLLHAVLMVSNVPQPKLHLGSNALWRWTQILVVGTVYVVVPLNWMPVIPFAVSMLFTVGGFAYGVAHADEILNYQEPETAEA